MASQQFELWPIFSRESSSKQQLHKVIPFTLPSSNMEPDKVAPIEGQWSSRILLSGSTAIGEMIAFAKGKRPSKDTF